MILGVIYDPIRDEMFAAEKGQGFTVNGVAAQVTDYSKLSDGLLAFDAGYNYERNRELLAMAGSLRENSHCMRALGSMALALAYIACGRITAYLQRFVYPWDIAAGILMIAEAGGVTTDWNNSPARLSSDQIIASNGKVHRELIELLKR